MTRSLFLTKLMLKCKPNYKGIPELQPQKNYSSLPQLCTPSQKEEKINHEIQETGIQYRKEKKGILTIKARSHSNNSSVAILESNFSRHKQNNNRIQSFRKDASGGEATNGLPTCTAEHLVGCAESFLQAVRMGE